MPILTSIYNRFKLYIMIIDVHDFMLSFFNYMYIYILYCHIFKRSLNFFMSFFYDFLITIFLLHNSTLQALLYRAT